MHDLAADGDGGRGGDGSEWGSIKDVDGEMMSNTLSIEEALKTLPLEEAFRRLGNLYCIDYTQLQAKMAAMEARVATLERPWYQTRAKKKGGEGGRLGALLGELEKLREAGAGGEAGEI